MKQTARKTLSEFHLIGCGFNTFLMAAVVWKYEGKVL